MKANIFLDDSLNQKMDRDGIVQIKFSDISVADRCQTVLNRFVSLAT